MGEVSIIGLDVAKRVFQVHGACPNGRALLRKKLIRGQLLPFLSQQSRCIVAMEACASAHFWARAIQELGHEVRIIPPIYVKPFVRRQKNDAADAEAIAEADGVDNPRRHRCAIVDVLITTEGGVRVGSYHNRSGYRQECF